MRFFAIISVAALTLLLTACSTNPSDTTVSTQSTAAPTPPATQPHVHSWTAEVTLPTCTQDGFTTERCDCGQTRQVDPVGALGHTDGQWVQTQAPGKTEPGSQQLSCAVCEVVLREEQIPATGSLGLSYELNEDGVSCTLVSAEQCQDTQVVIPEYYQGSKVTAIADEAFAGNNIMTEIHIPANIETIGSGIFSGCTALTTVYYDSAYSDMYNPFLAEPSIQRVVFNGNTVPDYICMYHSNIREILLGENVTAIGIAAFRGTAIEELAIPETVTTIGVYAFTNCIELRQIVIPEGVATIGDYAFMGCMKAESLRLPGSLTEISAYAFENCIALTEVVIPQGVTKIGFCAFYNCKGLERVVVADTVTEVGDYAFTFNLALTDVQLPEGLIRIGDGAFSECASLTEICIPSTVTQIGMRAFFNDPELSCIRFAGIVAQWETIDKGDNWNKFTGELMILCTDGQIP